jgi:hypothetical protein
LEIKCENCTDSDAFVDPNLLYAEHIQTLTDGLTINGPHTQHIHDFLDDHHENLQEINRNINTYGEEPKDSLLED